MECVHRKQLMRDLELTLKTVENIVSLLHKVSNSLSSLTCFHLLPLLWRIFNLFAEMREGNDMLLVLQFSHRLPSTLREPFFKWFEAKYQAVGSIILLAPSHITQNRRDSFLSHYTKQKGFLPFILHKTEGIPSFHITQNRRDSFLSHYTKQKGFLPFTRLPAMPKPSPNSTVTTLQPAEMRKWREEFFRSVRQVTVRSKSTNDNPDNQLLCWKTISVSTCRLSTFRKKNPINKVWQILLFLRFQSFVVINSCVAKIFSQVRTDFHNSSAYSDN